MTLVLLKAMSVRNMQYERDWIAFIFLTAISDILLIAMMVGVFSEVPQVFIVESKTSSLGKGFWAWAFIVMMICTKFSALTMHIHINSGDK